MRRGSRERVRHRHETLRQRLGGTATIRNSPGVYGSAYGAPDGQYSHRAELRRFSEETVYNSAGVAGALRRESRRANVHRQTRMAGRSFDGRQHIVHCSVLARADQSKYRADDAQGCFGGAETQGASGPGFVCSAGWDTECCSMGRLTRLNQFKLAYFGPNIDNLVGRVPKSGHRAYSGCGLQLNKVLS